MRARGEERRRGWGDGGCSSGQELLLSVRLKRETFPLISLMHSSHTETTTKGGRVQHRGKEQRNKTCNQFENLKAKKKRVEEQRGGGGAGGGEGGTIVSIENQSESGQGFLRRGVRSQLVGGRGVHV